MSREIFSKPGIPEDTETTKTREENRLRDLKESGHRPPELEKFLDNIDFEKLKSLFLEIARKSGLEKDADLNFLGRDRIFAKNHWYKGGSFSPEYNTAFLSNLEKALRIYEYTKSKGLELRVFQSSVHEETHAVSKNICVGWRKDPKGDDESEYSQSGYNSYDLSKDDDRFHFLNEAVTEKLSREICARYIKEVGWPGATDEDIKVFIQKLTAEPNPDDEDDFKLSYSVEVEFLNALIQRLAEKHSLPKETIWGAFVRGFFEGQSLDEETVKQLFDETFDSDFLEELSQLSRKDSKKIKRLKTRHQLFTKSDERN
jgi:hypothetical protein